MRVAFDIGGVLTKFPRQFRELIVALDAAGHELFIVTDIPDVAQIDQLLALNGLADLIKPRNRHSANRERYGDMSKAVILAHHRIDMLIDDYDPYLAWDSRLGPAPIRLKVMPDNFRPYIAAEWNNVGPDFGNYVADIADLA